MSADRFQIVGTVVASVYRVESVVAEGGFGVVYRARHSGFRAPVALKCLKVPQHLAPEHQARFLEQFRAEAELMFRLSASTPHVTRPLHVDVMTTASGAFVPFMVLEWLDGDTLDRLIRARAQADEPPFSLVELIDLLAPVAQALDRAHHFHGPNGAETIAHCDLKPENVFVARVNGERVVKILDFGVANVRDAATQAAKGHAVTMGLFTPAYGAPEQWNPRELGETGPWTDVWGLALTLVEALVGRPVIDGDHNSVRLQILDRSRRPTPRQNGVAVSDRVESVFARALAVSPNERPEDARAFWSALVEAASAREAPPNVAALEIPDLVPLARNPSQPDLHVAQGSVSFDFDDSPGSSADLALDLPADEPRPRRSLSPVPENMFIEPTSLALAPTLSADAVGADRRAPATSVPPGLASPSLAPPSLAPPSLRAPLPARDSGKPALPAPAAPMMPVSISSKPTERSVARRIAPGLALAAASIVLTLLDRVYAAATGEVFALGPVRTSWVAAALLVGGLGLATRELLAGD